jgi:hypothetical protein
VRNAGIGGSVRAGGRAGSSSDSVVCTIAMAIAGSISIVMVLAISLVVVVASSGSFSGELEK